MDKDQNQDLNEESSDECEGITESISADWEVDTAGNAYSTGNKQRGDLGSLKDEFKESG